MQDARVVPEDDDIGNHQQHDPERLRPDLQAAGRQPVRRTVENEDLSGVGVTILVFEAGDREIVVGIAVKVAGRQGHGEGHAAARRLARDRLGSPPLCSVEPWASRGAVNDVDRFDTEIVVDRLAGHNREICIAVAVEVGRRGRRNRWSRAGARREHSHQGDDHDKSQQPNRPVRAELRFIKVDLTACSPW